MKDTIFRFFTDISTTNEMLVPGAGRVLRYISTSLVTLNTFIVTIGSLMLNTVNDRAVARAHMTRMQIEMLKPNLAHLLRWINLFECSVASSSSLPEGSAASGRTLMTCSLSIMATLLDPVMVEVEREEERVARNPFLEARVGDLRRYGLIFALRRAFNIYDVVAR